MESWSDLAKQLWWEMTPQTNYHGTPYTFNKFDDSKFLTGEGAMAHGAGHYSADLFDTADKYNISKLNVPENFIDRYELPSRFLEFDEPTQKFSIKNKISQLNTFASDTSYPEQLRQSWSMKAKELNNFLDNLSYIKKGNTYKVNVPNENFMLDISKPFDEQSKYTKEAIYQMFKGNDISENVKDSWMGLNRFKQNDTRYIYNWLAEDIADKMSEELHWASWNTQRKAGAPNASKIFDKYGIKGIRAEGRRDGGINVTFSGKNIKMANTIPQQIRNKIPVQTLKKMARKLYGYPIVKGGVKFLDMFGPSLVIPDVIKLTHPELYPYTNRDKQQMKQRLEKKYNIKIDGNRITL